MIIQIFEKTYQDQVVEVISTIQREEFNIDITPEQQPDLRDIPGFYQANNGNFWLALEENRVIGTIALLDLDHKEAALRKMFVHRDCRGKERSVAKQLLDQLLQWSKRHNIERVYLGTTPVFLAAHRFYEKNGFIEIQKEELPKRFPVMDVDKKFYKYSV